MNDARFVLLAAVVLMLTGCPVAVTDTYTLEPENEGQGGASGGCQDRVMNGDETDVDCGGADCDACRTGQVCREASDCVSQVCTADVCG